jgi:magnesium-transporting ATPase (P-type)
MPLFVQLHSCLKHRLKHLVQRHLGNVVADGLPGFALGKEPAEKGIMDEAPIPKNEGIFARGLWNS